MSALRSVPLALRPPLWLWLVLVLLASGECRPIRRLPSAYRPVDSQVRARSPSSTDPSPTSVFRSAETPSSAATSIISTVTRFVIQWPHNPTTHPLDREAPTRTTAVHSFVVEWLDGKPHPATFGRSANCFVSHDARYFWPDRSAGSKPIPKPFKPSTQRSSLTTRASRSSTPPIRRSTAPRTGSWSSRASAERTPEPTCVNAHSFVDPLLYL